MTCNFSSKGRYSAVIVVPRWPLNWKVRSKQRLIYKEEWARPSVTKIYWLRSTWKISSDSRQFARTGLCAIKQHAGVHVTLIKSCNDHTCISCWISMEHTHIAGIIQTQIRMSTYLVLGIQMQLLAWSTLHFVCMYGFVCMCVSWDMQQYVAISIHVSADDRA